MNVSSTHRFSGWRGLNQTQVYSLRIDHKVGTTHTPTLRLVLERGCDESVNLQLSVPSVSALAWGSGMSRDAPPDDGKIPKERGRSLLGRLKKNYKTSLFIGEQTTNAACQWRVIWKWLGKQTYALSPDSADCARLGGLADLLHFDPLHVLHVIMDHLQNSKQKHPKGS